MVKNPPEMQELQETWVQSVSWEDLLEKGMAGHSSILAWRISRTEEPGGLPFGIPMKGNSGYSEQDYFRRGYSK